MFSKKMQYVIKSVPTEDKQALENLLNEMSDQGWELYTMHEVETENSFDFNCIFARQKQEEDSTDLDDIISVTSFKSRMEKMLAAPTTPYATCKEIQLKISNQGGIIAFRYSNDTISEYVSNDEEINHSELLKKSNITEEDLNAKLNFKYKVIVLKYNNCY